MVVKWVGLMAVCWAEKRVVTKVVLRAVKTV